MSAEDFAANLRLLCSYHDSVSEVCRQLGFNRQQFQKYVTGACLPSARNRRRICDFFGIEPDDLLLPPARFAASLRSRRRSNGEGGALLHRVNYLTRKFSGEPGAAAKYYGYYHKYFYSLSVPGKILKSLLCMFSYEGMTYYKNVEVLRKPRGHAGATFTFKYLGVVVNLGDRLHLIDYEACLENEISQTVLYPSFKNRVSYLPGLMIGLAASEGHQPTAARVMLQYLGRSIRLRSAFAACGLFDEDAPEIDERVRDYVTNTIAPGEYGLTAQPTA